MELVYLKVACTTMVLLLLGGCAALKSAAREPTEGPRSRIRLAAFAGELEVEVREPGGGKGTLYTRSDFYLGKASDLGMPLGPSGQHGRNEYYVVGDQYPVATIHVMRVLQNTPGGQWQTTCNVSGTFHVGIGKDYEVEAVIQQPSSRDSISRCAIRVTEMTPSATGQIAYRWVPVTLIAPHIGQ